MEFDGFYDTVKQAWETAPIMQDTRKMINAKFKRTRYSLKNWSKKVSNLKEIINNCLYTLALLDGIEEQRSLSVVEIFLERLWKFTQEKCWRPKGFIGKVEPNLNWQNWVMRILNSFTLLQLSNIEETLSPP
jgi:hypothetical protein